MRNSIFSRFFPALLALGFFTLAGWYYCGRSSLASRSCSAPRAAGGGEIPCRPLLCTQLQLAICSDASNANYCQGAASCSSASCLLRQYAVRLVATDTTLPDTFYLQYRTLSVSVNFAVTQPQSGGLSFIDTSATRQCNAGRYDISEFGLESKRVTLDLNDYYANPCSDIPDTIVFINGFADLFTVAVNVYPTETVDLICGDLVYDSNEGGYYTCFEDGQAGKDLFGCGPASSPVSGATPGFPAGTEDNQAVQLILEEVSSQGALPCEMAIAIENTDTLVSTLNVYEMDFAVNITLSQVMDSIYPVAASAVTDYAWQKVQHNDSMLTLHIQVHNNVLVNAGNRRTLFTIHVSSPELLSVSSSAAFSFDAAKGRMRTGYGCSRLKLSADTAGCSVGGYPYCSEHDVPVLFMVSAPAQTGLCDDQLQVDIGMLPPNSGNFSLKLYRLAIELDFEHSAGITIAGASTDGSHEWGCPANNSGCNGAAAATCLAYATGGTHTQFSYCFEVDTMEPHDLFIPEEGAFIRVYFNYPGYGCIQSVRLRRLELGLIDQNANLAVPVCVPDLDSVSGFPLCPLVDQIVGVIIKADTTELVEDVAVHSQALGQGYAVCQNDDVSTCDTPNYAVCVCPEYEHYRITPYKNNDPLNGVSTFDLVLINKHILGVELLNSPYKMIAADANRSKSIIPSDLIGLRKLILGIFNNFDSIGGNTSWRFVESIYQFPNPANPFAETSWAEPVTTYPNFANNPVDTVNFIAIKVGDVNGNANTNCSPVQRPEFSRPVFSLSLPVQNTAKGEFLTVPVRYTGDLPLEAFQLGLRFDPAHLELVGPSRGDARGYTPGHFNLERAKSGEIRTLWFADPLDEDSRLLPGQTLFYLSFRALQSSKDQAPLLQTDDGLLSNLAWTPAGAEYAVQVQPEAAARSRSEAPAGALQAAPRPNPATGAVRFQVHSAAGGKARFSLFGPFGNRVYYREAVLAAGESAIEVQETAGLAAGVYIWQIRLDAEKIEGRLVKQ